jgi:NADH-quinone oxidoreductase subunit C
MILEKIKNAMAALTPLKISVTEYAAKGFHLDVEIAPEQVMAAAQAADQAAFTLEAVTGVDLLTFEPSASKPAKKPAGDETGEQPDATPKAKPAPQMEVVYDFSHWQELCRVVVRARIPRDNPEISSIAAVYPGANWHERETHDFFGIKFIGHPDLKPLLLPEDADFHPLLKDFKA